MNHSNIKLNATTIKINNIDRRRAASPSTDSSISSAEVKRCKKLSYFHGAGKKEWQHTEWIVNNVDIADALYRFRRRSIAEVEKSNNINGMRILALSHIFPVNQFDRSRSIMQYLDVDQCNALKSVVDEKKRKIKLGPAKAMLYCQKAASSEDDEDDEDEGKDEDEDGSARMTMLKKIVDDLKENHASADESSEATFMDKHLMPILKKVLLNTEATYAIMDKPTRDGKKPDFMIGMEIRKHKIHFFFVEVKRPDTSSKYQPEDDFVKLMKLMKASIDEQLTFGVETPTSLGLLIEGFKCTLFEMTLSFDGVYMPIAFARFSLVEEIHQLVLLPSALDAFCFVKVTF
ncbi:hypothetical protein EDC96DRAFT_465202 [Choanephora cucurbitarum]|nr:hypothetical protein EDC96DRAFT_465199 [Choanephora cucurbitarum]KAI8357866.1 hypothetical protein EDC96DRAFT_465202 [Choanephora cucurbitarum]